MVDPMPHSPACADVPDRPPPSLHVILIPAEAGQSVRVVIYEACQWCSATVAYCDGREPARRFHRSWRAQLATWIATWDHRHDLWGSGHPGS